MDTESMKKTQDRQKTPQGKASQVDKSRRAFARAGMAAPVFLTLASRPVFGAQCLSAMMSGNMSHAGEGSCEAGFSISTWSNPHASLLGSDAVARAVERDHGKEVFQWAGTKGFIYGKFQVTPASPAPGTPCDYTGGTKFNEVFPALSVYEEGHGLVGGPVSMRQVLCDEPSSVKAHFVAAMLNAQYVPNYILTPEQVLELWSGLSPVPIDFTDINSFLESTWGA